MSLFTRLLMLAALLAALILPTVALATGDDCDDAKATATTNDDCGCDDDDSIVWTDTGATWNNDDDCDDEHSGPCDAIGRATIIGTRNDDRIVGTAGNDVVWSGPGRDTVYGLGGHDHLCGGAHGDRLYGGPGNDTLAGEYGIDYLDGGPGLDTCGVAVPGPAFHRRDSFRNCERLVGW